MESINPTSSYQVRLPDEIESQQDGRVSSFWLDGQPLLLQISSYIRSEGDQVSAERRLRERLAKAPGTQTSVSANLNDHAPDQAASEILDANGMSWLHVYLVWPHLAVYASISGPVEEIHNEESWARSALKRLALRVQ